MSSIMRARNGLMGRGEVSEVIGLSPGLKVAAPSMLGIGGPDRHALPRITSPRTRRPQRVVPPARAGSFSDPTRSLAFAFGTALPAPYRPFPGLVVKHGVEWLFAV